MKTKSLKLFVIITIGSIGLLLISCKEKSKTVKPVEVSFKKEGELKLFKAQNDSLITILDIEIADTDYDVQTGLMYRDSMKENQGMLFVFPTMRQRSFYMKNTKFPLDIIYIDNNKKIVSFQKNAQPLDESSLPSNVPAQFVLEVNAGLVDIWQLAIGDRIVYEETKY